MTSKHRSPQPKPYQYIFAVIFPPLALLRHSWDKIAIATILWFSMWPLGSIAAFYFLLDGSHYDNWKADQFGGAYTHTPSKAKRNVDYPPTQTPHQYIELADGELLEVVDPDDEERLHRLSR